MKSDKGETGGKLSVADFDPRGPPNKAVNTPRSLAACEAVGVRPEDLFLWSPEEFAERLAQEGIESRDPEADYHQYLSEFEAILLAVREAREELVTNGKVKNGKATFYPGGRVDGAKMPEGDEEDSDDEDAEEEKIKSKNLSKTSKTKRPSKKRPRTANAGPTKETLKQFQTTQYLANPKRKPRDSKENDDEDDAPAGLGSLRDASQKLSGSDKCHDIEIKEQRRQANFLQTTSYADQKRERLMRKILEGNIQSKKIKILKEGTAELNL